MTSITVPPGSETRIFMVPPMAYVMVAPPGVEPELGILRRPGVSGLFTFDPDVTWPSAQGCRYATEYLRSGHPILLQYERLEDALHAQQRLRREMAQ